MKDLRVPDHETYVCRGAVGETDRHIYRKADNGDRKCSEKLT